MIFHYRQRILTENDIPRLMINNAISERVTEFNFLGLTVNEYMNWNSHTQKIANKISRTLGVMNRLKRYLPFSAMKLMYDSLILSHLQFGITNWGFEWERCYVSTDVTFQCININRWVLWKRTTEIKQALKRKGVYLRWPPCCGWQRLCLLFLEWQPYPRPAIVVDHGDFFRFRNKRQYQWTTNDKVLCHDIIF